jgi:demethylmenaquinone methyltransferase/2-methoxy-6-polyprenyl-1,4-benzoquinol methylase
VTARTEHARRLFAGIASDYDRWAQLLSFGQDARWHDVMVSHLAPALPDSSATVLDVATGTAAVAIAIARRYGCTVTGVDQSPEMLDRGRVRVEVAGLARRIELAEARAEDLPFDDASFDAVTHTYLLRYVDDPAATLAELARVLRPGGIMASLEFGVPQGPAFAAWRAWTRIGLPAAGLVAGDGWYETGRFLGPSIEGFWAEHPLDDVLAMWAAAGMRQVSAQRLSVGGGLVIRAAKA